MRFSKLMLPLLVCAGLALPAVAEAAPAVRLQQVDGGQGYYSRFQRALPSRPGYFPVGVWFENAETQSEIDLDKDAGLNLYVGVACPECANEALIRSNGMRALIQSDERTRFNDVAAETAGWLVADELDMTDGPPGGNGFQIIQDILAGLPGDGRLRYTNYGKGVLLWQDDPWPAQWVNQYQHVVSTDLYWFTDPNQIGMAGPPWLPERGRQMALSEVRRAANYGYQIDRLRDLDARDGRRQPIWTLVEVGWPFVESAEQGGRAITAPEIRAAVWHSIIAGARGIVYFNHDFGGPCISQHVLRDTCGAAVRPTVKAVNRQIRTLAPVLNAPTVSSGWTAGSSIRAMVKWQGGRFYVLAGSRENRSSTGRFSMPCVGNAQAVRLGEAGSVPVTHGSFSDSFADGNAIHIYEIHGGSTCGLVPGRSGGGGPGGSSGRWVTRVGRVPRRVSLRSRRLRVPVTCSARCTVRSRLTTRYRSRRVLLSATVRRFGPGPHKIALLLTRQDRRRVADGRAMRLRTVIVQPGSRVKRTQLIRARRR